MMDASQRACIGSAAAPADTRGRLASVPGWFLGWRWPHGRLAWLRFQTGSLQLDRAEASPRGEDGPEGEAGCKKSLKL